MAGILLTVLLMVTWSLAESRTLEVVPGVYSWTQDDIYISLFAVTGAGVVAIEPVTIAHSTGLLEAIRNVTDEPIKFLIHTHDHWDHSKGNGLFREAGAKIVAHQDAATWMEANPHPDMVQPDTVWSGDCQDLVLGNTTLKLLYMGLNHGQGMTIVQLPVQKLVYVADLVVPKRVLFNIVPDFNIPEWERTLEEIIKLDFDHAVFTHSNDHEDLLKGTKEDVVAQLQFMRDLREAMHDLIAKGTNPFAVPDTVRLPKYKDWAFYDQWLAMNAWRMFLDEHMGPYPWRAPTTTTTEAPEVNNNMMGLQNNLMGLQYYLPTNWIRSFFGQSSRPMVYYGKK